MDTNTAHALVHFGLGRRGSEPLPRDPKAWLLRQLHAQDLPRIDPPATTEFGLLTLRRDRENRANKPAEPGARPLFTRQANAELVHALTTPAPFRERLVWFWTNHFTISVRRGECTAVACAFIEEAIRPHVAGTFADMLLAVMRHPAMLMYLDNARSIGPTSQAASVRGGGLNENLARECLELHTVTPAAGYSQTDVTALARVLTGWSIDLQRDPPGYQFRARAHEPGAQTVMGRSFPPGEEGGVAALRFLGTHPATYRFLATKLTRHFTADTPDPADIRRVEAALFNTSGNLAAAIEAVVSLDSAWRPGNKLRSPQDLVIAAIRALDPPETNRPNVLGVLAALGQPFLTAPAPNGWPDVAADWSSPEAMMRRIDWANGFAGRLGARDPMEIADTALGPLLRPATRDAMALAGSRRDAFTLLLTSPEFQRR